MRVFILTHKGKNRKSFFFNIILFAKELTLADNIKVNAGYMFSRRKCAKQYLETLENKDDYAITGITIELPKSKRKGIKKKK